MGVVDGNAKHRIVHEMTFGGIREKGEGGPVNETTEWSKIHECELAEVMNDIVKRILRLRVKFSTGGRILIQEMDVNSAFRQIGVDPAGAAAFGYVVADYIAVDMRLQFGWRRSPRWWWVVASAMQDAQRRKTRATAVILEAGIGATSHVLIVPMMGEKLESLPVGCEVPTMEGAGLGMGRGCGFYG